MNGQSTSLLSFKLKKLMAIASTGVDVSENIRVLLETDRILRAERHEAMVQEPMRLLITHAMADAARL
jgi:hypothetical protein